MNLLSDEMRRNPYPLYEQMRASSPVLHVPSMDLWMLFDYESVKRALTDHDTFHSNMAGISGRGNPEWFVFFDPPRHTKLRALVTRAFTPRSIASLEPRIRDLSRELLDAQIERGEMDLVLDYAIPLPTMVIAEMLGIPVADRQQFTRWVDVILNLSHDVLGGEAAQKATNAFRVARDEMAVYLAVLLEERRRAPKDDLLTRLVEAEVDGERLTEGDILGFFQLLLVAGTETTTNLVSNAMLSFFDNPGELARLRSTPQLLPSMIEEVLRYRSPVQYVFRGTSREVELRGGVIPAGKLVLPILGAANHDPAQFENPGRFDIGRDPNPHIAFGHGIHFCLGAALSRLEARIALPDLLERLKGVEPASSEPWQPRHALHVHGPARLPIRFEPGRRSSDRV
ncbi:cytochrome P450 [Polyangium aurulentum]|nr:cytochrome P450 [Polyangium aurulentum]